MTEPAVAEVALVRLRGRNGYPTGSLVKGVAGIKAVALVASGEVFPVLVDNLPEALRAEYDAFKAELEAAAAEAEAPAKPLRPEVDGDGDGTVDDGEDTEGEATSVPELQERAKALGIKGFSSMKKADLIEAIEAAEAAES